MAENEQHDAPHPPRLNPDFTAGVNPAGVLETVMRTMQQQLPDAMRTALADHLWAQIGVPIWEWNSAPAQPANVPLTVQAQTQGGPELITSITYSIPSGATGTLQLGAFDLPIFGGEVVCLPFVSLLLGPTDTRAITANITGPVGLSICGEQRPAYGVLSR
jgi:hypothetical protein